MPGIGHLLAGVGSWLVAAVLVSAALGKLVSFRATTGVLEQVGFRRAPELGAGAVIAAESTIATLYLAFPGSVLVAALVVALFVGFALVGARELRLKRHVRCGCFGGGFERELGWPQVVQLPVVVVIAVAGVSSGSSRGTQSFLAMFIAAQLAAAVGFSLQAIKPSMRVRRQRVSLAAPGRSWRVDD